MSSWFIVALTGVLIVAGLSIVVVVLLALREAGPTNFMAECPRCGRPEMRFTWSDVAKKKYGQDLFRCLNCGYTEFRDIVG